jgi:hypothetical protein
LAGDPLFGDRSSDRGVIRTLILEHLVDRLRREVSMHTFCSELGGESGSTSRTMSEAVPNERGCDSRIVNEPSVAEPVEAEVDASGRESLLPESPLQLHASSRTVGDKVQSRVTHTDVCVGVEEGVLFVRGKGVSYTEATSLQRFEHDFEGLRSLNMDQDA